MPATNRRFAFLAWSVALILMIACISGYQIGKTIAMQENAEEGKSHGPNG